MASYTPGIDVSRYEGEIDWKQVAAAGYRFAVIRATVGNYYTDPRLYSNWAAAKEVGLLVSAYHVLVATNYADKQIDWLFSTLGNRKSDFPLILDIEREDNVSNAANTVCIQDCIREMAKYDSRKPIIYTAQYYWKDHVLTSPDWGKYDLWVAAYSSKPYLPPGWTDWKFWQYSESGKVSGITGGVDLNWFQGTYDDLVSYAGQAPEAATEATSNLKVNVVATVLTLRSGPGISYKNIGSLVKGNSFGIMNVGGSDAWLEIESGKWVACFCGGQQYMEIVPAEKTGGALTARSLVDQLNIRSGPSTSYASLGKLNNGNVVNVMGIDGRDIWVQLELGKWAAFFYNSIRYLELVK